MALLPPSARPRARWMFARRLLSARGCALNDQSHLVRVRVTVTLTLTLTLTPTPTRTP